MLMIVKVPGGEAEICIDALKFKGVKPKREQNYYTQRL